MYNSTVIFFEPVRATRCLFLCLLLFVLSASVGATELKKNTPIVGVGAHFSWIIFNRLENELEDRTGRDIELHGEGSLLGVGCNAGIKNAKKNRPGHETFGFVCCPLSDKEVKSKDLIVYPLAREPILTLVNKNNPVKNLSAEQVRAIFKGDIVNWKEVGGIDKPIVVVARLHCKHRPGHWKTILPSDKVFRQERLNVTSAGEMVEQINNLPNAIGHIGSTWDFKDNDQVKTITVDGYAPTANNLKTNLYPFHRQLSAVTDKNPGKDVLEIIRYVQTSSSFLEVAKQYELMPIRSSSATSP